jgi:hypothetical protein
MITMPPLLGDDTKPMRWYGVKFDSGSIAIEITDEGGGAFLSIETTGEAWRVEAEELLAFAEWAKAIVDAMDKHNATT